MIKLDNRSIQLSYLGFERDAEAVYSYFQAENIGTIKKLEVTNTILHEMFTDQINMMHIKVKDNEQSDKLNYPDTNAEFKF